MINIGDSALSNASILHFDPTFTDGTAAEMTSVQIARYEQPPLRRFRQFETADVAVAEGLGSKIMSAHRLWADERGPFHDSFSAAGVGETTLAIQRLTNVSKLQSLEPLSFYSLLWVTRSGLEIIADGEHLSVGEGCAVVLSPTERLQIHYGADVEIRGAKVPVDVMTRQLGVLAGEPVKQPPRLEPRISGREAAWVSVLEMAIDVIDRRSSGAFLAGLGQHLEQTLVTTLLLGQPGSHSQALLHAVTPAEPRIVRAVAERMRADPATIPSMSALAGEFGVAVRRLQLGFRAVYGKPPSVFLRDVRLDEVHRRLQACSGASAGTVSDTAFDVGFTHLGRFAAAYRARFGFNPSRTLREA